MTQWAHKSQLPDPVRAVLEAELQRAEVEDRAIEAATIRSIRETRLAMRVPALCKALKAAHPDLPMQKVFLVVSLYTGHVQGHVRNLYYQAVQAAARGAQR